MLQITSLVYNMSDKFFQVLRWDRYRGFYSHFPQKSNHFQVPVRVAVLISELQSSLDVKKEKKTSFSNEHKAVMSYLHRPNCIKMVFGYKVTEKSV